MAQLGLRSADYRSDRPRRGPASWILSQTLSPFFHINRRPSAEPWEQIRTLSDSHLSPYFSSPTHTQAGSCQCGGDLPCFLTRFIPTPFQAAQRLSSWGISPRMGTRSSEQREGVVCALCITSASILVPTEIGGKVANFCSRWLAVSSPTTGITSFSANQGPQVWSFVTKKKMSPIPHQPSPIMQAPTSPAIPHSRPHSSQCKASLP
jgi:hypothetical protein